VPKPMMAGPHILGSEPVAFCMRAVISMQSVRRASSAMPSRKAVTLVDVGLVLSSAIAGSSLSGSMMPQVTRGPNLRRGERRFRPCKALRSQVHDREQGRAAVEAGVAL